MTYTFNAEAVRIEAARWAYRLFLDRDPESEAVLAAVQKSDSRSLREAFIASFEFAGLVQRPAPTPPRIVSVDASANEVEVEVSKNNSDKLREHVQNTWTRLGLEAPHWSVLSADEFRPDNISRTQEAFFESGNHDLEMLVGILARHKMTPRDLPVCFEFGSGLGRVTLPLARTFKRVIACDISTSHLEVARQRAADARLDNIMFAHADSRDFGIRERFDLWFSRIVLQHNPPPIMHAILDQAFSNLSKGGLAVFQIPTYATGYRFETNSYVRQIAASGEIEMHCLPQRHIFKLANHHGLDVLEVREDFSAGPHEHWVSNVFVLRRPK